MHLVFALLLFGLLSGFASAEKIGTVVPLEAATVSQVADPQLKKFLKAIHASPVDTSGNPILKEALATTASALQKQLLPKHGPGTVHFVLVDDMRPNAFFAKLENGDSVVGLNLGTLAYTESDGEVKFIFGHELEHGVSSLQAVINKMRNGEDSYLAPALQRAVENEVDIKSVLDHMITQGDNPHAAIRFLERLLEDYGNGTSLSHTKTSNRANTLALLIEHLTREKGIRIESEKYETILTKPIRSYLHSPEFRALQMKRIQLFMEFSQNPAVPLYEKIKDGNLEKFPKNPYVSIFYNRWDKISRIAHQVLNQRELLDLQIELHQRLDKQFEEARKQVLTDAFEPTDPAQYDAFRAMNLHAYPLAVPNYIVTNQKLKSAKKKLKKIERQLSMTLSPEKRKELESQREASLRKEKLEKARLELARSVYEPSAIPELESVRIPTDFFEREKWENPVDVYACLKVLGPLRQRGKDLVEKHMDFYFAPPLNQNLEDATKVMTQRWQKFPELPPEKKTQTAQIILDGFLKLIEHSTQPKTPGKFSPYSKRTFTEIHRTIGGYASPLNIVFDHLVENDRPAAVKFVQRYLSSLLDATSNGDALGAILSRVGPPLSNYSRTNNKNLGVGEGLQIAPQLAKDVFTPDFFNTYVGKLLGVLQRTIKTPTQSPEPQKVSQQQTPEEESEERKIKEQRALYERQKRLINLSDVVKSLDAPLMPISRGGILSEEMAKHCKSLEEIQTSIAPLRKNIIETFSHYCNAPMTEKEAEALVLTMNPALFGLIPAQLRPSNAEILHSLSTLNQKYPSGTITLPTLSMKKLESTVLKGLPLEALYQFTFENPNLVVPFSKFTYLEDNDNEQRERNAEASANRALNYRHWLLKRGSETRGEIAHLLTSDFTYSSNKKSEELEKTTKEEIRNGFFSLLKASKKSTYPERVKEATEAFWRERATVYWDPSRNYRIVKELTERLPSSNVEHMGFCMGYTEGVESFHRSQTEYFKNGGTKNREAFEDNKPHIGEEGPIPTGILLSDKYILTAFEPRRFSKEPSLELQIKTWKLMIRHSKEPSPNLDSVFETLWEKSSPALKEKLLMDEELVEKLYFDYNKKALALAQLDHKLQLHAEKAALQSGKSQPPFRLTLRPIIKKLRDTLDLQFKTPSLAKNAVLREIEDSLLTNDRETRFLGQRKLSYENWQSEKMVAAIDLPDILNEYIKTNFDRLSLVKYVIGHTSQVPSFISGMSEHKLEKATLALQTMRTRFHDAPLPVRTFTLQPYLSEKTGILGEEGTKEELYRLIMGEYYNDPIAKAVLLAYLDSMQKSQVKVVLGHILSAFSDRPGTKRASLGALFDAMGPFGHRAAQFLRTSGLVSEALRKELNHYFEHADPPDRPEILSRMKQVFGKRLRGVPTVRQLVGSGSLNYVVLADLEHPQTKKVVRVAIRFKREAIGERIGNENEIWEKAIERLKSNPLTQDSAEILGEMRSHAMEKLGPKGTELNLKHERDHLDLAITAYDSPPDESGFRTRAVRPIEEFQALVPADLQESVSVYEYIPNTPLKEIPDENLRQSLALQIVDKELEQISRGIFDQDPHIGNWLRDLAAKEQVRIDYAQIDSFPREEVDAFKNVLRAMVVPKPLEDIDADFLLSLGKVFEGMEPPLENLEETVSSILSEKDFPSYRQVVDRIFYMRRKLQEKYDMHPMNKVRLRLNRTARSAIGSLARLNIFREYTGDRQLLEKLYEKLDLDFNEYKGDIFQAELNRRIENTVRSISGMGGKIRAFCGLFLSKIGAQAPQE